MLLHNYAYYVLWVLLPVAGWIAESWIGASAEELSAAVQWYYWGFFVSPLITYALPCTLLCEQLLFCTLLSDQNTAHCVPPLWPVG